MTLEARPEGFSEPAPLDKTACDPKASCVVTCCSPSLKMFIGVLAFSFLSKSLSGSYTKSTITQIERRFEISSSVVGTIDGSFEMGNLLVITFVSYFGAKFHRPRIIGAGLLLMGMGTLLMALPHFLMGRYNYETVASYSKDADNFTVTSPCSSTSQNGEENGSPTWILVMFGNVIRGIGEATVGPLGVSFIDDFARPENSAFYIVIGPLLGYSLGSICANIYVDFGFVNLDNVAITPQDSRWVGAWWLGFIVAGILSLLSAVPFWFLPRALPEAGRPGQLFGGSKGHKFCSKPVSSALDFVPSLKRLLSNRIYILYLISHVAIFNAFVIIVTYTPKYVEQHFGQSASRANVLLGVTTIPATCVGIFLSGLIMKRFKLGMLGAARLGLLTSVAGFLCSMPYFALSCPNTDMAGITVPYQGEVEGGVLSSCNTECGCPMNQWDPVCGQNGVSYVSACYAGCNSTHGLGRNMTFHGCRCVQTWGMSDGNSSAVLGQCPRHSSCSRMFYVYLVLQALSFFFYCLGSVCTFIICLRSVQPELKSLSTGVFMLVLRVLGGIPAPIYFGALIDSTCLKWGTRRCGGRGACRMYDTQTFRFLFLGLISCLRLCGYAVFWLMVVSIKAKVQREQRATAEVELEKGVGAAVEAGALLKDSLATEKCGALKPVTESV
uniref:Solute carrier organic anion transporter family member n=1 Tax=Electrophorus electricus TaxID=8005 RepID=A0A4W4G6I4_ELEEL